MSVALSLEREGSMGPGQLVRQHGMHGAIEMSLCRVVDLPLGPDGKQPTLTYVSRSDLG